MPDSASRTQRRLPKLFFVPPSSVANVSDWIGRKELLPTCEEPRELVQDLPWNKTGFLRVSRK
jgi:hypothetical protein